MHNHFPNAVGIKRQSHQAYDQVTTNVRSKIVRIVLKSQKQRTAGRRGRRLNLIKIEVKPGLNYMFKTVFILISHL